ncbi:rifamycin-inactivating phosphotransferase [Pendulispora albinea]|uniref:Phosphoenolpyruvate synthase n=1 Tax=Pendulispora albinea TaxID=2741071 RepID=A0ABZ2LV97_9BACT
MEKYVLDFADVDKTKLRLVGGKGANLGELSRIEGIRVPDGFCVSTEAFARIMGEAPAVHEWLNRLSGLEPEQRERIGELSQEIRRIIEGVAVPEDIRVEVSSALTRLGAHHAYAVRSSATAEDLPTASFAGQQDTYLNVIGEQEILRHIRRCWASLFTDRAVTYRLRNGFDHRQVRLAVVIQRMIVPQAAGVLFTADPISSNRKVSTIDASFGLGEALVSGRVSADVYKVRDGKVIDKKVSTKKLAIHALPAGGTIEQEIGPGSQNRQTLTDEQILQLERLGRKLEGHFGHPQDIEWCLADGTFHVVQSRPITTLYPVPRAADRANHVYVSVGHQQMMTDPMKPLGLSLFQITAARSMFEAGGRLFVDVTKGLASAASRANLLDILGQSDPLIENALVTLLERGDFIESTPGDPSDLGRIKSHRGMSSADILAPVENDPGMVSDLIERSEAALAALRQNIRSKSGPELFDFILEDIQQLTKTLWDSKNLAAIVAGIHASAWINDKMKEWLGEKNAADTIAQSVPDNITSEMGLALLDIADVIRPYPEVIEHLQRATGDDVLDGLAKLDGGRETRDALGAFLDKYGMRCVGEIDITRPRWSERPETLVPLILGNVKNTPPGSGKRKFEERRQEALRKEQALLERLKQLPDGERRASETKQMIELVRKFMGYREYPKYGKVSRYFVYKQALLKEAERLVREGVIDEKEDIYYLTFDELQEVARTRRLDRSIIGQRKDEHRSFEKLTPPRVITSDGEIIAGEYKRRNLPAEAMVGLPVSSGVTEGRARVILDMKDAELEEGDILITPFTDPSWTPLFVSIKGLVTEVGGLMTHGAVIAREYGLPAVVGVEHATQRIKDGQRIRVNGTDGYVEIL